MRRLVWLTILLTTVALAVTLRGVYLAADVPANVQDGFISDEGWWAHNARAKVLHGDWVVDDFNQGRYASPMYTYLVYVVYQFFGVGLAQTRLVSAMAGLATLAATFFLVRGSLGGRAALVTVLLLSMNYFYGTHNRLGYVESLQLMFIVVALAAWQAAHKQCGWAVPAGMAFVAAIFTKSNAVFFLPVMGLIYWAHWRYPEPELTGPARQWPPLALAATGAAVALALLAGAMLVPEWEAFRAANQRLAAENLQPSLADIARNAAGFGMQKDHLAAPLAHAPILVLGSLWYLLILAAQSIRKRWAVWHDLSFVERLAVIWLAVQVTVLIATPYKPTGSFQHLPDRRLLNLIVPLAILTASGLTVRWWVPLSAWRDARWPGRLLLSAVAGAPVLVFCRGPVARWFCELAAELPLGDQAGISVETALVPAAAMLLAGAICAGWTTMTVWSRRRELVTSPLLGTLTAAALWQGVLWAEAFSSPSYTMLATSQRLADRLQGDLLVMGDVADTLCLNNRAGTLTVMDRRHIQHGIINEETLAQLRPTALLHRVKDFERYDRFTRELLHRHGLRNIQFAETFQLCPDRHGNPGRYRFHLYRLQWHPRGVASVTAPRSSHTG